MEDQTRKLLTEQIEAILKELDSLPQGKDRDAAVDSLCKLYRLRIDEDKNETELRKVQDDNFAKEQIAENELRSARIDRWVGYGLQALGIVLPLSFYAVWMKRGLQFEETGSFTSKTFQGLTKFFKPTVTG